MDSLISKLDRTASLTSIIRQSRWLFRLLPLSVLLVMMIHEPLRAAPDSVLAECLALTDNEDEIHNCLDNILDTADSDMAELNRRVRRMLEGDALAAFNRAQEAFVSYRKENCLWYLDITEPRSIAEQVAKDCLARMSRERLTELRTLINGVSASTVTLRGHIMDVGSRRVFQACGRDSRYQLGGDAATLAALRQYLASRGGGAEPVEVVLRGVIEENAELDTNLAGVVRLRSLSEVPEGDDAEADENVCPVPDVSDLPVDGGGGNESTGDEGAVDEDAVDEDALAAFSDGFVALGEDAAQPITATGDKQTPTEGEALVAYFGSWQVDCAVERRDRVCTLSSQFQPEEDGATEIGNASPELQIRRLKAGRSMVILNFPGREVDSPAKFRWRIDNWQMGDIVGSVIRVDADGTRQLVDDTAFVEGEIIPKLKRGSSMGVTLLDNVDDETGEAFEATLVGITRALEFADEYIQ
ncbi:MAG: hypothetical protein CSB44_08140 [Gammaproteobacteria bacterium]|nr:MAG: hypothetical protein CSB44_08140 [Gammaproteobacteria bacterium]PIE36894.1 MAG: hypothetical protein CSA54_02880 [Gammaproteobacteria bacterium]